MSGFLRVMLLREAAASTALSHDAGCVCLACRAADGDEEAFAELLAMVAEREDQLRVDAETGKQRADG